MKLRILTAAVGIPLLLALIYFDFGLETAWFDRIPLFMAAVAAAAATGAWEFYRLGVHAGARPLTLMGVIFSLLFVVAALFDINWASAALLGAAVIAPLVMLAIFRRDSLLQSWVWTLAGILYMGWALGYYINLRQFHDPQGIAIGRELVIFTIFATFACDTSAYFIGRAWGRHHMAPVISPHKTWEGAAGGLAGAVLGAVALRYLLNLGDWSLPFSYVEAALAGAVVGIVAQLGDLAESLLKRQAGVKDSGKLLPGHGGALDRIDSLVFTGVVVYYLVQWVVD